MHDFMAPLGFGQHDRHRHRRARCAACCRRPSGSASAYRKKEQQKWYAGETISLGIGQGYNTFTMLQLAQATATLAAGGQRYKPHLVRAVEDVRHARAQPRRRRRAAAAAAGSPSTSRSSSSAMYGVTQEGTSARSFVDAPYKTGGKTGTAQVIEHQGEREVQRRARSTSTTATTRCTSRSRRSRRRTIALALVVENAGFGAGAAAPIARRVFDYVLQGQYPSEEDIAATQLGKSTAPIGTPRPIDAVPLPGRHASTARRRRARSAPTPVGAAPR